LGPGWRPQRRPSRNGAAPARSRPAVSFMIPMLILNMASGFSRCITSCECAKFATCAACATSSHAIGEAWRTIRGRCADHFRGGRSHDRSHRQGGFCAMRARGEHAHEDPQGRFTAPSQGTRRILSCAGGGKKKNKEGVLRESAGDGGTRHAKKRGRRSSAISLAMANTRRRPAYYRAPPRRRGAVAAAQAPAQRGIEPLVQSYITAHGTSTPAWDIAATQALKLFLAQRAEVRRCSTKACDGHMLGASGAIEMPLRRIDSNRHRPPTINYQVPDPECDFTTCPTPARQLESQSYHQHSFGFGATMPHRAKIH